MNQDLKIIKKKYGEKMMKLCRELFPTILEEEGLLSQLMIDHFEPSQILYDDIISNGLKKEFKNFIYRLVNIEETEKNNYKTPKELLEEAGYDLYECHTEEEIQSFKKYYQKKEKLCTFNGNRLERCYVFFAVKKDVDNIKREDFKNPRREDLYGTSVISIQFTKDEKHTLSIKNRYNHTVDNPDATFHNNLDNIIEGLTESFSREYGMTQANSSNNFEIPNYVRASDGKYYKYNYEINNIHNNIYYCTNNVIIDNFEVKKLEHNKLLIDYFILDLQNMNISFYDDTMPDSFPDGLKNIEQIQIIKELEGKKIIIKTNQEDIIIKIDNENKIIEYENNNIKKIENNFLKFNESLIRINISNVIEIEDNFLYYNKTLNQINISNVRKIGDHFLCYNETLSQIYLPKVIEIGDFFLHYNETLSQIYLPHVIKIGAWFLYKNNSLLQIYLPKIEEVESYFLNFNESLIDIDLSNLSEEYYRHLNSYVQQLILKQKSKEIKYFLLN